MTTARLVAAAWLVGCSGGAGQPGGASAPRAPVAWVDVQGEGLHYRMPGPVRTKRGRDGKAAARIDHALVNGARFESAWFGFPVSVERPEMDALLDAVERGLAGAQGTRLVAKRDTERFGRPARRLELELADGKLGIWDLTFPTPASLLEMSAVGPSPARWRPDVEGFFGSLHVP